MTDRIDLVPLLDLQAVDEQITRLEALLAALPEETELAAALAEHAEIAPVHEERVVERTRLAREQDRLEAEIASLRDKLAREQGRLASGTVTSPREIVALQAETDALTRRIAALEDDELEIMEAAEAVDATLAELTAQLDAAGARVAAATAARDAAAEAHAAALGELRERRGRMIPGVDTAILERYEQLRRTQGGIVVAPFDGKACGGCGLPLSPAAREEFRSSDDLWFACENCRRVLVPR